MCERVCMCVSKVRVQEPSRLFRAERAHLFRLSKCSLLAVIFFNQIRTTLSIGFVPALFN